jgi:prepilin-type N-terminal cleavage/methylation domain-containing protein
MSNQIKAKSLKQRGFTLIEVLVTAASASLIIGASIYGLTRADQVSKVADEKLVIEDRFQQAMQYMASDLQEARSITLDASLIPPEVNFVPVYMIETPRGRTAFYHRVPQPDEIWFGPQVVWFKQYLNGEPPTDINPLVDQVASVDPPNCPTTGWSSFKSAPEIGVKLYLSDVPTQATKALICVSGTTDPLKYPYTRHTFTRSMVVTLRAKSRP